MKTIAYILLVAMMFLTTACPSYYWAPNEILTLRIENPKYRGALFCINENYPDTTHLDWGNTEDFPRDTNSYVLKHFKTREELLKFKPCLQLVIAFDWAKTELEYMEFSRRTLERNNWVIVLD